MLKHIIRQKLECQTHRFWICDQSQEFNKTFCGSPSYTAPQIAKKQKYKSEKIDIWCLGVTLYAMLTGQLPFDGKSLKETRQKIIDLKYQNKKYFSNQSKQIFYQIFIQECQRSSIQQLQQTIFYKNGFKTTSNFINSQIEQISIDNYILEVINKQFSVSKKQLIESISNFRLNQIYSLYYLTVQKQVAQGVVVKSDICSEKFQKKRKQSTLRTIIQKQVGQKNMFIQNPQFDLGPQNKPRRNDFRVRLKINSMNTRNSLSKLRNTSQQSPRKYLGALAQFRSTPIFI